MRIEQKGIAGTRREGRRRIAGGEGGCVVSTGGQLGVFVYVLRAGTVDELRCSSDTRIWQRIALEVYAGC